MRASNDFLSYIFASICAIAVTTLLTSHARANASFWDDGIGDNKRWDNFRNWNPDGVPSFFTDVTLGQFIYFNTLIDARDYTTFNVYDEHNIIEANSLAISTVNPFRLEGYYFVPWYGGVATYLDLRSGDVTRHDVAGTEGEQVLNVIVRLFDDAHWNIGGSGQLVVGAIEAAGQRTFTKTGAGTLNTSLNIPRVAAINEGVFRGSIAAERVDVEPTAIFYAEGHTSAPVNLRGIVGSFGSASLKASEAVISGHLTIRDTPGINVDEGGELELAGGITSVDNSALRLVGAGEVQLTGPSATPIPISVFNGQLTIAHNNALGPGAANVSVINFGSSVNPVIALADGITFDKPLSMRQSTIRSLGNTTVTSNITLTAPLFPIESTINVPGDDHTLNIHGSIGESFAGFSLRVTGGGTVVFSGSNTFSGGLTASEGNIINNGSVTQSTTQVLADTVVGGSGQFADLNVQAEGQLAPGTTANLAVFSPATLTVDDLSFNAANAELHIQLGGTAPGTEHDQLLVNGNALLAGNLFVSLQAGFTLGANDSFEILDVVGTRTGQFSGLGEGALVGSFGGRDLFITYAADDGNDVALFTASDLPGDFNHDGAVDAADYVLWRKSPIQHGGNPGGYDTWHANFGTAAGAGGSPVAAPAVPEPAGFILVCIVAMAAMASGRRTLF